MPGPLPKPSRRRRNAPVVPTTTLVSGGRTDPAPEVPEWSHLGDAGQAWWAWAWATPQALAWGTAVGMESWVARRASLEDDLSAIESVDGLDWLELADAENARDFRDVVGRVAAMVTGRLSIMREMREMDDRLGLSPKGMAQLRWTIVDETPKAPAVRTSTTSTKNRRERLLKAVGDGSD